MPSVRVFLSFLMMVWSSSQLSFEDLTVLGAGHHPDLVCPDTLGLPLDMIVEPIHDLAEHTAFLVAALFTSWLEFLFNTGKAQ